MIIHVVSVMHMVDRQHGRSTSQSARRRAANVRVVSKMSLPLTVVDRLLQAGIRSMFAEHLHG